VPEKSKDWPAKRGELLDWTTTNVALFPKSLNDLVFNPKRKAWLDHQCSTTGKKANTEIFSPLFGYMDNEFVYWRYDLKSLEEPIETTEDQFPEEIVSEESVMQDGEGKTQENNLEMDDLDNQPHPATGYPTDIIGMPEGEGFVDDMLEIIETEDQQY